MNLNQKILVRLGLVLFVILSATFLAVHFLLRDRFLKVESGLAEQNLNQASDAVQSYLNNLQIKASDWSNWDDTYYHMQKYDTTYIKSNFFPATLNNLNINYIILLDPNRKPYSYIFHTLDNQLASNSQTVLDFFTNFQASSTPLTGFLPIDSQTHVVTFQAISNSAGTATPAGTLIFGRILSPDLIKQFSDTTHLDIKISPPDSNQTVSGITISRLNSNQIITSKQLNSLLLSPILKISVTTQRQVYQEYYLIVKLIGAIMLLTLIVTLLIIYTLINKTVLFRLKKNIATVLKISSSGSTSSRIEIEGSDEISDLDKAVNAMLDKLHESQKHLKFERDQAQTIISSMGEGLLVVDADRKITIINPVAEKLLEITSDQVVGKVWSDVVTTLKGNQSTPTEERSFAKTLKQGQTIVTKLEDDHYYQTKSGKIFPIVSVTAPFYSGNKIIGAIKLFHDATAEKQAAALVEQTVVNRTRELKVKNQALEDARQQISEGWLQLQKEKARLTASLSNLPLGLILTDKDQNIIFQNPKVQQILETNNPETFLAGIQKTTEIEHLEYQNKILHLFFAPIYTEQEFIGTAILIEDITEAKILERSKDEFFSIASHELRTPLTAIRGNSALLMDYYCDKFGDTNSKEMITDIHDASVRLIGIVNDFLDLSRLETGKISFQKSTFAIKPLVDDTLKPFIESNPNSSINLINLITDDSLSASADPDRTRQVLTNLIGNAYKYTEKGEIRISCQELPDQIQIDISDTGRGIPASQHALLFRKFQQAGENLYTRDTTKSTGLGLYISKLIVEAMGGKIWLNKSDPATGSVFSFTLPKE